MCAEGLVCSRESLYGNKDHCLRSVSKATVGLWCTSMCSSGPNGYLHLCLAGEVRTGSFAVDPTPLMCSASSMLVVC